MRVARVEAIVGMVLLVSPAIAYAQQTAVGRLPVVERDRHQAGAIEEEVPCADLPEEERRATLRCQTDEERREDEYARIQREREEREQPERTSFLKWIHVDGLWMANNIGLRSYGVIGTHVAVMEVGRLHLYGPPGVMLVMENDGEAWRARPGLTWGFSLRLADMRLPGSTKNVRLFLNVAKVWTTGNVRTGRDMMGLSFTWGD